MATILLIVIYISFIGLGIGPIFPNFIYLMPQSFGKDVSQSVIGSQMTASYVSIMTVPPLFGLLGGKIGLWILPVFVAVAILMLVIFVLRFKCLTEK